MNQNVSPLIAAILAKDVHTIRSLAVKPEYRDMEVEGKTPLDCCVYAHDLAVTDNRLKDAAYFNAVTQLLLNAGAKYLYGLKQREGSKSWKTMPKKHESKHIGADPSEPNSDEEMVWSSMPAAGFATNGNVPPALREKMKAVEGDPRFAAPSFNKNSRQYKTERESAGQVEATATEVAVPTKNSEANRIRLMRHDYEKSRAKGQMRPTLAAELESFYRLAPGSLRNGQAPLPQTEYQRRKAATQGTTDQRIARHVATLADPSVPQTTKAGIIGYLRNRYEIGRRIGSLTPVLTDALEQALRLPKGSLADGKSNLPATRRTRIPSSLARPSSAVAKPQITKETPHVDPIHSAAVQARLDYQRAMQLAHRIHSLPSSYRPAGSSRSRMAAQPFADGRTGTSSRQVAGSSGG